MAKTIVILGTLDTKGEQLQLLKDKILARGHRAILMDMGMGSEPRVKPDITAREIAGLMGHDTEEFRASRDRFAKAEVMVAGAQMMIADLLARDEVDGAVALGGASMALIGARVMSRLPFGIPKLIATSAAMPAYVSEWFDSMDVAVMQVIMEFTGLNNLLTNAIAQVAGAISGMVEESSSRSSLTLPFPSVAITEIGFCPKCAQQVETLLEAKGYHVFPFHAQGISERAMDNLISQGFFDGVIDIVPAGLIEEIYQGNRPAGMARLDAAAERGIPQIIAPSTVNLTGCGVTRKNREKYASRPRIMKMDELRSMTRFNAEELTYAATVYRDKLNKAKGPVKFFVPLKGWSAIDREGTVLYDPDGDLVFVDALRQGLDPKVEIVEVPCNLEDLEFAVAMVEAFDIIFKQSHKHEDKVQHV
ncbi:MAG: Tm-1-like ATP-binding domain-containing protein [Syntrophorhabdus sp.]|nr:Tm-1-like ATP-binding domain-containing protein [Syntrophorhabdus sp.]HQP54916.1 Tm-1-like ATP-binding domain-containing protein [Syntrophorhabdus sp.]